MDVTTPIGLRDSALIGLIAYSGRPDWRGAALRMRVKDVYVQNWRL